MYSLRFVSVHVHSLRRNVRIYTLHTMLLIVFHLELAQHRILRNVFALMASTMRHKMTSQLHFVSYILVGTERQSADSMHT